MGAVLIDAVRTPTALVNGQLKGWHPVSLLAEVLNGATNRSTIRPEHVQRVIAGCATPIGDQAMNVARNAVLAAGWPELIPASSVDGQAMSGLFALADIVALVNSGAIEVGIAAGVESATRVPDASTSGVAVGKPFGPMVHERYIDVDGLVPPGMVAESLAHRLRIERDSLDEYAIRSRGRFENAQKSARFKDELLSIALKNDRGVDTASSVHEDTMVLVGDELLPIFEVDGLLTAATFAGPADGAAALTIVDSEFAKTNELPGLARVIDVKICGTDPIGGDSGAELVSQLLTKHDLDPTALNRIEMHEDTAVTPMAMAKQLKLDPVSINPDGGALAKGVAMGAAGPALVAALVHGLVRNQGRYGVAVMAGFGGLAGAVLVECGANA